MRTQRDGVLTGHSSSPSPQVFGSSQVKVLKEHYNAAKAGGHGGGGGGGGGAGGSHGAHADGGGHGGAGGGHGGGGGAAAELAQRKLAAVGSLADVLFEVANAAAKSSEWQTKCLQIKAVSGGDERGGQGSGKGRCKAAERYYVGSRGARVLGLWRMRGRDEGVGEEGHGELRGGRRGRRVWV